MNDVITVDPLLLSLLAGALIPLVIGLVTKSSLSSSWKAVVSLVLAAISGTLIQINNSGSNSFHWKEALVATTLTAITSVASYLGVWKPVASVNDSLYPGFGVGPKPVDNNP